MTFSIFSRVVMHLFMMLVEFGILFPYAISSTSNSLVLLGIILIPLTLFAHFMGLKAVYDDVVKNAPTDQNNVI